MKIRRGLKRETRVQFAALCYRYKNDKLQVLLITSRQRGRWILPKGWPENGLTPAKAALREAFEEGGVKGTAIDTCVGVYNYSKIRGPMAGMPKVVMVFPVAVDKLVKSYPEANERRRKWFGRKAAAARVDEPQLRKILKSFDPGTLFVAE